MKKTIIYLSLLLVITSCEKLNLNKLENSWVRHPENPVYRDKIINENYEVASDPHVFYDTNGQLWMIYSGDVNGNISIKLAKGNSLTDWTYETNLLYKTGSSGLDSKKETAFYRFSNSGKHQIYYIGYPDEEKYESQIYLAEADSLEGPYTQMDDPLVSLGTIAGKQVEVITSPSIVEHEGKLYMSFIGWNGFDDVTKIWVLGAISKDDGYTWTDFQKTDVPIGMEGQVTKAPDGSFVAVRTSDYKRAEAVYYSTSDHPFGPWKKESEPILAQAGKPYEKDEIIAPQITFDPDTEEPYLFYTGADHKKGWWIMLASENGF